MEKTHAYVPGAEFPWQYKYEHMAVTTDCVIFTYEDPDLKVLLVRRGGEPCKGMWAFPGGFLRTNETAEQGALRELSEETSLTPSTPVVQLGVFSDVDRDPRERVLTIAFYALVKPSEVRGGDDADEAAWFPTGSLPPLAFDHRKIFEAAMERLRKDIHFQPVGFDLLDETFTIPDLQRLYESILGVKFDRRNFQRKILASGILDEVPPPDDSSDWAEIHDDGCRYEIAGSRIHRDSIPTTVKTKPKKHPGRKAASWSLNLERYSKMKEDGGKIEF